MENINVVGIKKKTIFLKVKLIINESLNVPFYRICIYIYLTFRYFRNIFYI